MSSLYVASVAELAGLSLTWSQTRKTGFLVTWLICYHQNCYRIVCKTVSFTQSYYFSGKVLQLNARGIPDYAIVPLNGYPVDKTVNSIVTNVWLVSYLKVEI